MPLPQRTRTSTPTRCYSQTRRRLWCSWTTRSARRRCRRPRRENTFWTHPTTACRRSTPSLQRRTPPGLPTPRRCVRPRAAPFRRLRAPPLSEGSACAEPRRTLAAVQPSHPGVARHCCCAGSQGAAAVPPVHPQPKAVGAGEGPGREGAVVSDGHCARPRARPWGDLRQRLPRRGTQPPPPRGLRASAAALGRARPRLAAARRRRRAQPTWRSFWPCHSPPRRRRRRRRRRCC